MPSPPALKEEQSSENFISGLSSRDSSESLHSSAAPPDVYQQIEAFQSPRGTSKLRNGGRYLTRVGVPGVLRNFLNTVGNEQHETASSHPTASEKASSFVET